MYICFAFAYRHIISIRPPEAAGVHIGKYFSQKHRTQINKFQVFAELKFKSRV